MEMALKVCLMQLFSVLSLSSLSLGNLLKVLLKVALPIALHLSGNNRRHHHHLRHLLHHLHRRHHHHRRRHHHHLLLQLMIWHHLHHQLRHRHHQICCCDPQLIVSLEIIWILAFINYFWKTIIRKEGVTTLLNDLERKCPLLK